MNTLLFKILNYESEIFNQYLSKRKLLIENIKEININELSQRQLLIFINDVKDIIEPIKTSNDSIDYFFTNTLFNKDDSIKSNESIKKALIYLFLDNGVSRSDEISLNSESSDELSSDSSE
jgi:hypothetical protein